MLFHAVTLLLPELAWLSAPITVLHPVFVEIQRGRALDQPTPVIRSDDRGREDRRIDLRLLSRVYPPRAASSALREVR